MNSISSRFLLLAAGSFMAGRTGCICAPYGCAPSPSEMRAQQAADNRLGRIAAERCPKEVHSYFNNGPLRVEGYLYSRSVAKGYSGKGWHDITFSTEILNELLQQGFLFVETEKRPNDGLRGKPPREASFFHEIVDAEVSSPGDYYRFTLVDRIDSKCRGFNEAIARRPDLAVIVAFAGLTKQRCIAVESIDNPRSRYWLVAKSAPGSYTTILDRETGKPHASAEIIRETDTNSPTWQWDCMHTFSTLGSKVTNETIFSSQTANTSTATRHITLVRQPLNPGMPSEFEIPISLISYVDVEARVPPVVRKRDDVFLVQGRVNVQDSIHIAGVNSSVPLLAIVNDDEVIQVALAGYGKPRRAKDIDGFIWIAFVDQRSQSPILRLSKLDRKGALLETLVAHVPILMEFAEFLDIADFHIVEGNVRLVGNIYRIEKFTGDYRLVREVLAELPLS